MIECLTCELTYGGVMWLNMMINKT